jgi:hypothetical protein
MEISLLSSMEPLNDLNEMELGVDGILVSLGNARGILLPQVAIEQPMSKEEFVSIASKKAGLGATGWKTPGVQLSRFRVLVISESQEGLNGDVLIFSEMKEGNFFGEMSLIDELPRSAAVSAIEDCRLMVLYQNDFNPFIKESPFAGVKYVLAMTKELSRRISKTNQNLEDYHFMCTGLIENEKFRELYKSIIH